MEDWKKIEAKARQIGDLEIVIDERISLVQMASGNYRPKIGDNMTEPNQLDPKDQNKIREEFGIPAVQDFDSNPLIPGNDFPAKKKKGESKFDRNPLIPD